MTRLVFINRYFYPDESATSQLLTDLAFRLADSGHELHVITSRQLLDDACAGLAPEEKIKNISVHRVWTSRWGRGHLFGRAMDYLTFYFSAAVSLMKHTRHGDVVIAKTDPPLISAVAAFVAWIRGAELVNWMQDIYPEIAVKLRVSGASFVKYPLRWARNRACRFASANVVIGRCMREFLAGTGVDAETISVIPNWVNDSLIQKIPREQNGLRMIWNLQENIVVGYSGNMGRSHAFEPLLRAAEELREQSGIKFLFIGNGAKKAELEARVRNSKLANVVFQPYQPYEVLPLSLTVPDIHVVTLQDELEGLLVPSKFYGAMAVGRPVIYIGPQSSEVARVIREAKCGFVLGGNKADELGDVLRTLCNDADLREEMGDNARRALESVYSRDQAFQAWRVLLDRVAAGAVAQPSIAPDVANR